MLLSSEQVTDSLGPDNRRVDASELNNKGTRAKAVNPKSRGLEVLKNQRDEGESPKPKIPGFRVLLNHPTGRRQKP